MSDSSKDSPSHPGHALRRKILKWTGISVGSLLALLIMAIVVIPHVVNLGPVKQEIERVASRQTDRQVTIAGPLSLSLFPWVGFDARDVSVANARGFGDKPLMHVSEAEIHVELLPLIIGTTKVSGITLDRLSLNLARNASGAGNWTGIGGTGTKQAGKPAPATARTTNLAGLSIGRIALNGMTINYDDARAGKHYTLSGINLKASRIASGRTFPLEFRFTFNSRQPHVNVVLDLTTGVRFDATLQHVELGNGKLSAKISGAGLNQPLDTSTRWKQIGIDLADNTAQLKGLEATAANTTLTLNGTAQNLRKQPVFNGHLAIDPFSPRKLLAALGNPIPGGLQGFNLASVESDIRVGANTISLDHLKLRLDSSTLTGRVSVPDLKRKALRFDLALDAINLNQYLPAGSGPARHAAAQHSSRFMETRLPGRLLSDLDMSGQLRIGKLDGFGLSAGDIRMTLSAAKGTVKLAPLAATLYGGSYKGNVTVARAGQGIRLDTGQTLAGIDAGKLVTALGGGSRISGNADARVQIKGQGNTVGELLETLKGNAAFEIRHGALEGINVWDSIERAYALVKEHKRLPASGPTRTEFTNFKATAKINQGVIDNDALEATLPFLSLTGHGQVNLIRHTLDYNLLAKVVKTPRTAGADLSQLKGLTVPLHLSGDFSQMSSVPDIKEALRARAKAEVRKKLDAQKKSAEKKLKDKFKNILGGGGGGGR